MKLPNILTALRIACIPLVVLVYYLPFADHLYYAAGIFALAAWTDWLDGYLARKLNQSTAFGAFLDPVADKLMVCVALGLLIEGHSSWLLTIPALIIIGREIVISALREWMAELGKRASIAVSMIGKAKTSLQMLSIFILLSQTPDTTTAYVGLVLLYISVVLTIWSMVQYLKAAWPDLKSGM
ncbi:CDP-diacylglycerol--glycerol-3-phosphate 3-phosphatidyltransferase [Oceanospirillum multiglobuliferum]|uniref:CDP-diacylglycerol--glycerol-3-phosphate 3-phosphatidyltransferase n=1 Tax=Oceanospirillum multiglobuliferum TaxID=64969 RepID=A0A1T4QU31_9GAMM|nr:CDP-diacylglycerol--glycerol-3-phosphate 3-phosphatidyltransferase [Oceanospirillum multiglobuliferum]OPX57121.1 CDP-diacylglycerol--glycerol-3-phosphate 3-phosphatidyltransferase [Oceanospirillum multiglobuliferum]SKA07194.1 CDP-diacylglycerol--glycerol-3-phosphate 3-phosphatidyltransferase [Oceanospirillum multiglobuliferum]